MSRLRSSSSHGFKYDTFLDFYLCESHLECHRGHLKLDDYYIKVLTLKEPSAQSFPLIFKNLLEVQANFHIVTEWKKEDSGKARKAIESKRRHFSPARLGAHFCRPSAPRFSLPSQTTSRPAPPANSLGGKTSSRSATTSPKASTTPG